MYFLDTSYILAIELRNDQNHHRAQLHWQKFRGNLPDILTTTYVFDEIVTFFNSRDQHKKAIEVGTLLLTSAKITLVHVESSLFQQSWAYFVRHQDKRFSLTDCVSFVLMRQYQITNVFTFDNHFKQAGFQMEPGD